MIRYLKRRMLVTTTLLQKCASVAKTCWGILKNAPIEVLANAVAAWVAYTFGPHWAVYNVLLLAVFIDWWSGFLVARRNGKVSSSKFIQKFFTLILFIFLIALFDKLTIFSNHLTWVVSATSGMMIMYELISIAENMKALGMGKLMPNFVLREVEKTLEDVNNEEKNNN